MKNPPIGGFFLGVPSVGTFLEVAYFLRYGLLVTTDQLLLMVRRRVAELWRTAGTDGHPVLAALHVLQLMPLHEESRTPD